jgi:hypothetical protein
MNKEKNENKRMNENCENGDVDEQRREQEIEDGGFKGLRVI